MFYCTLLAVQCRSPAMYIGCQSVALVLNFKLFLPVKRLFFSFVLNRICVPLVSWSVSLPLVLDYVYDVVICLYEVLCGTSVCSM